eukprot:scaffold4708_cov75-Phaeocystis_antarctica.AAC.2
MAAPKADASFKQCSGQPGGDSDGDGGGGGGGDGGGGGGDDGGEGFSGKYPLSAQPPRSRCTITPSDET